MARVDWITWKTDATEIIDPEKIDNEIAEYFQNYESYMTPMIYEQLRNEVNRGGLTKDAFNVSGISPANEMAVGILNEIEEINQTMKTLRADIKEVATKQKEIEKKQLIEAIEDKIKKEEVFLKNIESRDRIKHNIAKMGEDPNDIIYIINDRIRKLNERLEIARAL